MGALYSTTTGDSIIYNGCHQRNEALYKKHQGLLPSRTMQRFALFCVQYLFDSNTAHQQVEKKSTKTIDISTAEKLSAMYERQEKLVSLPILALPDASGIYRLDTAACNVQGSFVR